jgi:fused signal recognition particle receptor
MPREWSDLIMLGSGGAEPAVPGGEGGEASEAAPRRRGLLGRLRESLAQSREALTAEIGASLFETLDAGTWERLEEALIMADVGARTTAEVVGRLEGEVEAGRIEGGDAVRARLIELLAELAQVGDPRIDLREAPAVILVVGVNGTGKTTTIGKLSRRLRDLGASVLLAAGDTYRAAAVEQLSTWADRAGCEIVKAETGQDSGAVIFDAISAAEARAIDVVVADTAGRLHTRTDLMEELAKVNRVIEKKLGTGPAETLLVVDATTGQNGLRQAKVFSESVDVDGIVLTKLDGTAKGGIALAIAGELGIPVKMIGTGEGVEDLRPFAPTDFARVLLGDPDD